MIGVGSVISGYRIERVLGAGGMGTVYLAQNPELPRKDALKVLSAELSHDASFRARFVREADVAASLQHPNIVSIYSRGETDEGQLWIAMQFVDGMDADGALRQGTMTPARAVRIISEIASAVDYANDHHVVHRDIKPANFLLFGDTGAADRVLLGDFGIARGLDDFGLTLTGSIISTLAYAAPEVLTGSGFDRRADLYSLACSLFRLLTGNTPFAAAAANGPGAVMMAHLHAPPPRVTDFMPGLPKALNGVIATAMAKNPAERFVSADQFAAAAASALHRHCLPDVLMRAVPASIVDAKPTLADSNWWQPPAGTRTGYAMQALPTQSRPAPGRPAPSSMRHPSGRRNRWLVAVVATVSLLVAGTVAAVVWGRSTERAPGKTVAAASTTSSTTPAPPPPMAVAPSALRGLLLPVDQIQALMGGMNPKTIDIDLPWDLSGELESTQCLGPYEAGQNAVYGKYMFVGYQLQILVDKDNNLNTVTQSVIGFPSTAQATAVVNDQLRQWDQCANQTTTFHKDNVSQSVTIGSPTTDPSGAHVISVHFQYGGQDHCEHALTARENVVVDVSACSVRPGNQAVAVTDRIVDRIPHP